MTRPQKPKKRRSSWRARILLMVGTLVISLLLLEVVARWVVPKEIFSFGPVYTTDAEIGYRFKANQSEYAFGAQLATNSFGFRGPEWQLAKTPGTLRIALIGDSFAFGFGVEFDQTYGEQLANRLRALTDRPVEVLNFGVPGFNTVTELAVLRTCAFPFAPDLVLTLLVSNDHESSLLVDADGYLQHSGDTRVESQFTPRRSRWGFLRHSALLTWAKLQWSALQATESSDDEVLTANPAPNDWTAGLIPGPIQELDRERLLVPLLAMQADCSDREIPFVLASFATAQLFRRVVREIVTTTDTRHIDLVRLFPETASWDEMVEKFGLGWDSHPNAEAHGRWAEATASLLIEAQLVAPK